METQQQLATPASDAPEACGIEDLVALLRWRARIQGEDFAIGFIDEDEALADTITFAGLDARARAIGAWLARNGARGECVLLSFPTSVDYLCAFFGWKLNADRRFAGEPEAPRRTTVADIAAGKLDKDSHVVVDAEPLMAHAIRSAVSQQASHTSAIITAGFVPLAAASSTIGMQ